MEDMLDVKNSKIYDLKWSFIKFIIPMFFIYFKAFGDFGPCLTMFPNSKPPTVSKSQNTRELCYDSFAILYSVESKTAVYVVERLSSNQFGNGGQRTNDFHEEMKLAETERATLADYPHSSSSTKYDRGHLAPAGDMPNPQAMHESFSLANIVPQAPKNNRGIWAKSVETPTRKYVKRSIGYVYVFTGPYFEQNHGSIGNGNVWVPNFIWKLVYDSTTGKSWAFWIENSDEAKMKPPITKAELEGKLGIQFF